MIYFANFNINSNVTTLLISKLISVNIGNQIHDNKTNQVILSTEYDILGIKKELMNRLKLSLTQHRFVSLFNTHKMQGFFMKCLIFSRKDCKHLYIHIYGFFYFLFPLSDLIAIYQVGLCCTFVSQTFVSIVFV